MQTGPEGWLLAERPLLPADAAKQLAPPATPEKKKKKKKKEKEQDPTKYGCSTLPPETSLERLVTLAHARSLIEQFYEDAKGEGGLDQYQGRRWDGLQRHLAVVMLA